VSGPPRLERPTRRVVTGHDEKGRSVFVADGAPPVIHESPDGDAAFVEIWNTNQMPAPITATEPEPTDRPVAVPPRANGTIIRVVEIRPGRASPMHRTETIDYGIVLEGEIHLVLDDGAATRLGPGDVVVQRGTDHAWDNRSDRVCRIAFVLVDGTFSPEFRAALPGG
jgi:quercetin dioxygenase-like cupin family protein